MVQTQQATIAQLAKQLATVQQENQAAATQLVLERTTIAAKLEEHVTTSTQLIMANATANTELVLAYAAKNNTIVAQLETQVANLQKERTVAKTFFVCI
jgi:hypothetical protein